MAYERGQLQDLGTRDWYFRASSLLKQLAAVKAAPPPEPPKRPTEQEVVDMAEELTWKRLPQDDESTDSFLLDVVNAALERWSK